MLTRGGKSGGPPDARPTGRRASSQHTSPARPVRAVHAAVENPAVTRTVLAARNPSAMRPWAPQHNALQRDKGRVLPRPARIRVQHGAVNGFPGVIADTANDHRRRFNEHDTEDFAHAANWLAAPLPVCWSGPQVGGERSDRQTLDATPEPDVGGLLARYWRGFPPSCPAKRVRRECARDVAGGTVEIPDELHWLTRAY